MVAAELIQLLQQHPGREYQGFLRRSAVPRKGRPNAAPPAAPAPRYCFTVRGDAIEATGPSGQTRLLSPQSFAALFADAHFTDVAPTGRLSDLGPLFSTEQTDSPRTNQDSTL